MEVRMYKSLKKFGPKLIAIFLLTTTYSVQASAFQSVNISADHGGQIIDYAMRVMQAEQGKSQLRILGSCDSACTLYLGVSRKHICLAPNAIFRFHLPFGSSQKGNQFAARYMINSYPGWVRRWIGGRGGLTHNLISMNYSYAAKFLPTCSA